METPIPSVKDSISELRKKIKIRGNPYEVLSEYVDEYGDIFCLDFYGEKVGFLSHPEYIKHILMDKIKYTRIEVIKEYIRNFFGEVGLIISTDDILWRFHRDSLNKMFELNAMRLYAETIVNKTVDLMGEWENRSRQCIATKIEYDFVMLALKNLVSTVLYGQDIDLRALDQIQCLLLSKISQYMYIPFSILRMFRLKNIKDRRQYNKLKEMAVNMLNDKAHYSVNPVLNTLLLAYKNNRLELTATARDEISNELIVFMFAGQHTISSALTWTFVQLAQHFHVARSLHDEVSGVLKGSLPQYSDIEKMPYLQAVLKEMLRFSPIVPFIPREATEEDVITGYRIKKRMKVNCSVYHVHRHPDYWVNAEAFIPERFLNQPYGQLEKFAYLPFGVGPQACIGRNFAFLELSLVVATIIQKYYPVLALGQDIRPTPGLVARPQRNIKMFIRSF